MKEFLKFGACTRWTDRPEDDQRGEDRVPLVKVISEGAHAFKWCSSVPNETERQRDRKIAGCPSRPGPSP